MVPRAFQYLSIDIIKQFTNSPFQFKNIPSMFFQRAPCKVLNKNIIEPVESPDICINVSKAPKEGKPDFLSRSRTSEKINFSQSFRTSKFYWECFIGKMTFLTIFCISKLLYVDYMRKKRHGILHSILSIKNMFLILNKTSILFKKLIKWMHWVRLRSKFFFISYQCFGPNP